MEKFRVEAIPELQVNDNSQLQRALEVLPKVRANYVLVICRPENLATILEMVSIVLAVSVVKYVCSFHLSFNPSDTFIWSVCVFFILFSIRFLSSDKENFFNNQTFLGCGQGKFFFNNQELLCLEIISLMFYFRVLLKWEISQILLLARPKQHNKQNYFQSRC